MERLNPQDLMLLWPDDLGWPEEIGALAILDGAGLLDPDGRFRIETVREVIGSRLPLVPRFRQLLYAPRRGLGWPLWVDAQSFDLTEHVRVLPLTAPADEDQLLLAVEQLRRHRLRRSRPLWEMWFLPGLHGDLVGMFIRIHHTIADGAAGVAMLGAFLDPDAEARPTPAPSWTPAPIPSSRYLLEDNLRRRAQAAKEVVSKLGHPVTTLGQVRRTWPATREVFVNGRAPRTSLNRPISQQRTLTVIRGRLDVTRQIAHAHGAKLNDVLLSAVADGLRDLLRGRQERVEDVALRAFVPVSLHEEEQGRARGNQDGMMFVPLPLGVTDPGRRLRLIAAESAERKKRVFRPPEGVLARNIALQRAMVRSLVRQRRMNIYVADIPGPPMPLYLAGAQLLEVFPVVPIIGNVTLGIAALTYAGQFNVSVVADAKACPDVDVFAESLRNSLEALSPFRPHADAR
ncbi:wax ester/triacylglycerol synthase family O-acyltransferase [Streptomyces sp. NPDC015127]|uniref:wax ester/triacylglycerol synthase family O-acyltransferase n=1 Tax=Streptomyces sp. NPDC015127 TaxID=3364939 RepID=UPI003702119A